VRRRSLILTGFTGKLLYGPGSKTTMGGLTGRLAMMSLSHTSPPVTTTEARTAEKVSMKMAAPPSPIIIAFCHCNWLVRLVSQGVATAVKGVKVNLVTVK